MRLDLVPFGSLAGAPVHWGRWGRTGERKLARPFRLTLESALDELFNFWPWGRPAAILSGGAYVNRPASHADRHSVGTAFDLSGFAWGTSDEHPLGRWQEWRLIDRWDVAPKEAIAVEAVLRLHIPQVLGPRYNRAHRDHWHVDDREVARGFQVSSVSDVRFLQWALNEVWRPVNARELNLDGRWGAKTARAAATALEELGQPAVLTDGAVWRAWLEATACGGFGLVEAT